MANSEWSFDSDEIFNSPEAGERASQSRQLKGMGARIKSSISNMKARFKNDAQKAVHRTPLDTSAPSSLTEDVPSMSANQTLKSQLDGKPLPLLHQDQQVREMKILYDNRPHQHPPNSYSCINLQQEVDVIDDPNAVDTMKKKSLQLQETIAKGAAADSHLIAEWYRYVKEYSEGAYNLTYPPAPPATNSSFRFFQAAYPPDEVRRLQSTLKVHTSWTYRQSDEVVKHISAAAKSFGVRNGYVSLIDTNGEIIKGEIGSRIPATSRIRSIGGHVILSDEVLVVLDAEKDWRFAGNQLVVGKPGIRFFAGAPIVSHDDEIVGVFAIFDTEARSIFRRKERRMLVEMADSMFQDIMANAYAAEHQPFRSTPLLEREDLIFGDQYMNTEDKKKYVMGLDITDRQISSPSMGGSLDGLGQENRSHVQDHPVEDTPTPPASITLPSPAHHRSVPQNSDLDCSKGQKAKSNQQGRTATRASLLSVNFPPMENAEAKMSLWATRLNLDHLYVAEIGLNQAVPKAWCQFRITGFGTKNTPLPPVKWNLCALRSDKPQYFLVDNAVSGCHEYGSGYISVIEHNNEVPELRNHGFVMGIFRRPQAEKNLEINEDHLDHIRKYNNEMKAIVAEVLNRQTHPGAECRPKDTASSESCLDSELSSRRECLRRQT